MPPTSPNTTFFHLSLTPGLPLDGSRKNAPATVVPLSYQDDDLVVVIDGTD
jgi:hypothetical protein